MPPYTTNNHQPIWGSPFEFEQWFRVNELTSFALR